MIMLCVARLRARNRRGGEIREEENCLLILSLRSTLHSVSVRLWWYRILFSCFFRRKCERVRWESKNDNERTSDQWSSSVIHQEKQHKYKVKYDKQTTSASSSALPLHFSILLLLSFNQIKFKSKSNLSCCCCACATSRRWCAECLRLRRVSACSVCLWSIVCRRETSRV